MTIVETPTGEEEWFLFDSIKESRDGYFVEYSPPAHYRPFGMLSLIFTGKLEAEHVVGCIEQETQAWLQRFPVPVMASAYDDKEDLVVLSDYRESNYLTGWVSRDTQESRLKWRVGALDEHLRQHPLRVEDIKRVFEGVPFRTQKELRADASKFVSKQRKAALYLKTGLVFWLVLLPVAVAILEFAGPEWIGLMVFGYSLWQAARTWRKIIGQSAASELETLKVEKKRRMEHYFYHCERNPAGFARLVLENVNADSRRRVLAQEAELRSRL